MEAEMLLSNGAQVESVHQESGRNALAVASQYVFPDLLRAKYEAPCSRRAPL